MFRIKNHTLPGSPYIAEYLCGVCGRFERLVARDSAGDPPANHPCGCGTVADLAISSPKIAFWTRTPTAVNPPGATRKEAPDPRALDTRDLASGKLTERQWRAKQSELTKARRHARRIKAGRAQKRIQVNGVEIK
jgi:hypothetical protein